MEVETVLDVPDPKAPVEAAVQFLPSPALRPVNVLFLHIFKVPPLHRGGYTARAGSKSRKAPVKTKVATDE